MNEKTTGRGSHLVALRKMLLKHGRNETTAELSTEPHSPPAVTLHIGIAELPERQTARAGLWASVTSEFLGRGECGRRPLIIFNTAVPERLKTKSQLRKEL